MIGMIAFVLLFWVSVLLIWSRLKRRPAVPDWAFYGLALYIILMGAGFPVYLVNILKG